MRLTHGAMIVLLASAFLIGCAADIHAAWQESRRTGYWHASYGTWDGTDQSRFRAKEGQTIYLDYEVTVDKGMLTIQLVAPDGQPLWERTFREFDRGSTSVTATQEGRYHVHIVAEKAGGGFELSWRVAD